MAPNSPERNFEDYVHVVVGQGETPGSCVAGIEHAAVDAHAHLQEFKLARKQGVGQEPTDGVFSEEDAICSRWQREQYRGAFQILDQLHDAKPSPTSSSLPSSVGQAAAALS